jgi:stage V sporulation protein R
MREMDLSSEEIFEFARMHAGILMPGARQLNPYLLGIKIFEHIEANFGGIDQEAGRAKIFEVRETENDISFIRNYLSEAVVNELDLYTYQKVGNQWVIVEKNWTVVRDNLVTKMVNCNIPVIVVESGDYGRQGELYLKHLFEGVDLDIRHLEKTLKHICHIWGKSVHMETVINNKNVLFSTNGKQNTNKGLA